MTRINVVPAGELSDRHLSGNYQPTPEALSLNRQRLEERS